MVKLKFPFFHDFIIKKHEEGYVLFTEDETYIEDLNKESFFQNIFFNFPRIFYFFKPITGKIHRGEVVGRAGHR